MAPKSEVFVLPTQRDYNARVACVRKIMRLRNIDVLVFGGEPIRRFFTGLDGLPVTHPYWLVITSGSVGFVTPSGDADEITARCKTPWHARCAEWEEAEGTPRTHQDALARHLKQVAPEAKTIGMDHDGTTGSNIELLRETLGINRVSYVSDLVEELFRIKDADELKMIRESCKIAGIMVRASFDAIAVGVPEWKLGQASQIAATNYTAELLNGNEEISPLAQVLFMTGSGAKQCDRCHASRAY